MNVGVLHLLLCLIAVVLLIVLFAGDGGATESSAEDAAHRVEGTTASDFE